MAFGINHLLLLIVIGIFVYLYRANHSFRYYAKYTYYFIAGQFGAFLVMFIALTRPHDTANIRVFQKFVHFAWKILGIRLEKRNTTELETLRKPAILLVNHQSTLDIISLMEVSPPKATFLCKKSLLYAGYFGFTAWLSGLIFIDRLNPERAMNTMNNVVKTIQTKEIKLWVFPEGTRSMKPELKPFKKGAFHLAVQAQVPIYPLVLSSYLHFLDSKRKIWNPGKVIASVLPPIDTTGLTIDDVADLTTRVKDMMETEYKKITQEVQNEARRQGCSVLAE